MARAGWLRGLIALAVVVAMPAMAEPVDYTSGGLRGVVIPGYGECSGKGCCSETPRVRGGRACVLKQMSYRDPWLRIAEVDEADAEVGRHVPLRLVLGDWNHKTHRVNDAGNLRYGIADADGKVLVQPVHTRIVPISTTHAVSDQGLVDVARSRVLHPWRDDLREPMVFGSTGLGDGQRAVNPVVSVTADRPRSGVAGGRVCDVVFLDARGEPRWALADVVCPNARPSISRLGLYMVIGIHPAGGSARTLITDARGRYQADSPWPVEQFQLLPLRHGHGAGSGERKDVDGHHGPKAPPSTLYFGRPYFPSDAARYSAWRIARNPAPFIASLPWLYQPFDLQGLPMPLPDDVAGMVPILAAVGYGMANRKEVQRSAYNGWVLVEASQNGGVRLRVGSGRPLDVLEQRRQWVVLDRIEEGPPLSTAGEQLAGMPVGSGEPMWVARVADTGEWVVLDRRYPGLTSQRLAELRAAPATLGSARCSGGLWSVGLVESTDNLRRVSVSPQFAVDRFANVCLAGSREAAIEARLLHARHVDVAMRTAVEEQKQQWDTVLAARQRAGQAAQARNRQLAEDNARKLVREGRLNYYSVNEVICPTLGDQSPECRTGRSRYPSPPPTQPSSAEVFSSIMRAHMQNMQHCEKARRDAQLQQRDRQHRGSIGNVWVTLPEGC